ncbi:hypothetical protein [Streptomyces mirabilis]|uniref:hypothetical protein n=1 Tax=Streptomyces mirabilis TaxID=68239 RepID=UPI0036A50B17
MGSLFEELEAREAAARVQVEELEAELVELSGKLELARESLKRLRITRETVTEVLAEMETEMPVVADAGPSRSGERMASAYAGAERQVIGVLTVPKWQPGMMSDVLPSVYRDIVEVVADAPGPIRAKQIVPRIGLPAETGKIEGTRGPIHQWARVGAARAERAGGSGARSDILPTRPTGQASSDVTRSCSRPHGPERDPFDEVAHAWGKHAGCSQAAVPDGILCLDCVTHGVRLGLTAGRVDSNNQFFWK